MSLFIGTSVKDKSAVSVHSTENQSVANLHFCLESDCSSLIFRLGSQCSICFSSRLFNFINFDFSLILLQFQINKIGTKYLFGFYD